MKAINIDFNNFNNNAYNNDETNYNNSKITKVSRNPYLEPISEAVKEEIINRHEQKVISNNIHVLNRNHSGGVRKHIKITELSPQKQQPKSALHRKRKKGNGEFQSVAELILEKNDVLLRSYAEEMIRKKTGRIIKVKRPQKILDIFSENENLDEQIIEIEKEKNNFNLEEYQKNLVNTSI